MQMGTCFGKIELRQNALRLPNPCPSRGTGWGRGCQAAPLVRCRLSKASRSISSVSLLPVRCGVGFWA